LGVDGRLVTLSRVLSEAFQGAGEHQRRRTVLLACESAASQADLQAQPIEAALSSLRDGGSRVVTRLEIETSRGPFDAEYLRLQDQDDPAAKRDALLHFRRARAAAALAFALSSDAKELPEALYEAAFATDDQAGFVETMESALL